MLVNILLFQHYFAKFVTYYSQNYASIIGSGLMIAKSLKHWLKNRKPPAGELMGNQ